ncbi:hypothetical protein [Streptomyces anulatus]|uniref:hypothetical protein n=1 Tax=Streptomyces anulatus TaxID=1892 RepID=UPI0036A4CD42
MTSVPYRSIACWIGTHNSCIEQSPPATTDDAPVIYEVCICPCHSTPDPSVPVKVMA